VSTHAHVAEQRTADLIARGGRSIAPRQRLRVSEWADRHRWLTSKQSGEPGQWRTARNPILGEIMDACGLDNGVREIWLMKSVQGGASESTVNVLGYYMQHAPCPVMVLLPTEDERNKWKAQKLNPLLQETEVIRDLLGGVRTRDAANRADMIDFPGGILFMSGANSPNSYAQKTCRVVVSDDFDRFPQEIGDEGDPEMLVRGRVTTFPATSKLIFISTPTIKDVSLIERGYERTDKRRYQVPCPACGHRQRLVWGNMRWDKTHIIPAWAEYECEQCGHGIQENAKPMMLREGIWVPETPEILTKRGYHISAMTTPIGLGPSWLTLAQDFLVAKNDPSTLKVFINQRLGETWEDRAGKLRKVTSEALVKRASDYDMRVIPPGCLAISVGIDTQDEWLAVTMLGWGAPVHPFGPPRQFVLDWHEIRLPQRDTTHTEVWDELESYLHLPLVNSFGRPMKIRAAGIDSRGHRSKEVRDFVQRSSLRVPVYAVQGSTTRMNRPIAQAASDIDKNRRGKIVQGGYGVWNVGTEHAKNYLYNRIATDGELPEGERIIHYAAGMPMDYYDGLLAEVFDPEKGRYVKKTGARNKRNEPIDTLVYAWAIGHQKHTLIGLRNTRDGLVADPMFWVREAAKLEDGALNTPTKPVVDLPVQVAQVAAIPRPAAPRSAPNPMTKSDWSNRL
jgi:phage terminase large subunit GpA-like protein